MKNLLQSLLTPLVLILCAIAQITLFKASQQQSEIILIACFLFSLYTFIDVYSSLTTKNQ
tara:strand:- start:1389 stop:1568 length:180 start_codon:yes stop_codon:yes gene_type:complete